MAATGILISDSTNASYDGNLSTADGFYQVEAWNMGGFSTTDLILTTTRTIAVTFSNAGNCQGLVLALSTASAVIDRNVIVELYEGTTLRATETMSSAEITNSVANAICDGYNIPFVFATPYAVTTASATWSFKVYQSGGTTGNWNIRTSNATAPFYAAWCDTQVSFADGMTPIAGNAPIYIDQDATFAAQGLGTGETVRSICGLMCHSTDPTPKGLGMIRWKFPAAASYTLTLDGLLITSAHSAFQIGEMVALTGTLAVGATSGTLAVAWPYPTGTYQIHTSEGEYKNVTLTNGSTAVAWTGGLTWVASIYLGVANAIATKANVVSQAAPTYGSAGNSGICDFEVNVSVSAGQSVHRKTSIILTGEVPSVTTGTLAYDVLFGGTVTISIANPCVVTKTTHYMDNGRPYPVQFSTTGALPTGLTAGTVYWGLKTGASTFNLYPTYADAIAGTNIVVTSGTQSGVHTANSVIYVTDSTGFVAGDEIFLGRKVGSGYATSSKLTIGSVSGNRLITTTNEITRNCFTGGQVTKLNGYGIKVSSDTAGTYFRLLLVCPTNILLRGVEFCEAKSYWVYSAGSGSLDDDANSEKYLFTYCSGYYANSSNAMVGTFSVPFKGVRFFNTHSVNCCLLNNIDRMSGCGPQDITFCSNQNVYNYPIQTNGLLAANFEDCVFDNNNYGFYFSGTRAKIKRCKFWGGSTYNLGLNSIFYCEFEGNTFDLCNPAINFNAYNTFGNVDTNSIFGAEYPNVYDVGFFADAMPDYTFVSPTGLMSFNETNLILDADGTSLKVVDYNDTVDDFRSLTSFGRFYSVGSTQILSRTLQGVSNLINPYKFYTKVVSGFKMFVSVNVKIKNAAYYAGVHTLPNMTIDYDGDTTTSLTSASASTAQQTLEDIITFTTDRNDMIVNLNQKTDANGVGDAADEDADVTWDTLKTNLRGYGYTFRDFSTTIVKQTIDPMQIFLTPVANPFITETVAATVGAYSEFTIDHSAQTCTITADTTMAKLYDYTKWDLCQTANMGTAEWYTTLDGTNFTSTYDIVLNTGVDLTGGGTIDVGAGTFTKTGTATYDGVIIYTASREVHLSLAGLVAGSTVQVYNNDSTTELYNAVVAGTSLDYIFAYTVDAELRIRIRQAGYIPYEYTGNIVNTGLSLNVAQVVDSVYVANGIDGSTVTEFSFDGATIKVYVDDPDNATTGQRMYNWYMYALATTTYIGIQPNDITAQTAWSYVLADAIQLYNQDAVNPLFIQGANINNVSGNGQVIDTAGGKININGYFPFTSAGDVGQTVVDSGVLTVGKFLALK